MSSFNGYNNAYQTLWAIDSGIRISNISYVNMQFLTYKGTSRNQDRDVRNDNNDLDYIIHNPNCIYQIFILCRLVASASLHSFGIFYYVCPCD